MNNILLALPIVVVRHDNLSKGHPVPNMDFDTFANRRICDNGDNGDNGGSDINLIANIRYPTNHTTLADIDAFLNAAFRDTTLNEETDADTDADDYDISYDYTNPDINYDAQFWAHAPTKLIVDRVSFNADNVFFDNKIHRFTPHCGAYERCNLCAEYYDRKTLGHFDDASVYLRYGSIMGYVADNNPSISTAAFGATLYNLYIVVSVTPLRVIYPRIRMTPDMKIILGQDRSRIPKTLSYDTNLAKCRECHKTASAMPCELCNLRAALFHSDRLKSSFKRVPPNYLYNVYEIDALSHHGIQQVTIPTEMLFDRLDINNTDSYDRLSYKTSHPR